MFISGYENTYSIYSLKSKTISWIQ